ncbi:hypothetical protein HPB48_003325 [Haemaphysalis longicornis]|uniref:Methyltransferase domain-containing protein n=1 Tax=Haemaphysalis longicornis TaxID=44386 RepID=A0A9J6G0F8_HAELO|nr:hypothetical protein HPB48_003325 [Haemaphysalis longicornis]
MEGSLSNLGPGPFVELKEHSYRENLAAMQSVRFLRPCCEGDQHLDVGCGPGNFIQEHLLPHLRPCRRVVGVDSSWRCWTYARRHCREPEDLSGMLSDRFSYNAPVPWEELKQRERSAATAAGLDVVACHIYSSQWVFPTAEACLGSYIPFFKLDENIPRTKREEFWEDCRIALLETSPMTADGISQPYNVLVAHSRKAPSVP